jgi:hypothetical protein
VFVERERTVLRPRLGLGLAIAVWALSILNLVTFGVLHEWESLARGVPVALLVSVAAWVLFGIPSVVIEETAVTFVNPARSIRIPYPRVVDIEPSFSLVVRTTQGRYRAWAAPGGSQGAARPALQANERIVLNTALPDDGRIERSALEDPTDANMSNAEIAAMAIKRGMQLEHTTVNGALPPADDSPIGVHWHLAWLSVLAVLVVASVVALAA